jgi:hypothetical protein
MRSLPSSTFSSRSPLVQRSECAVVVVALIQAVANLHASAGENPIQGRKCRLSLTRLDSRDNGLWHSGTPGEPALAEVRSLASESHEARGDSIDGCVHGPMIPH